MFFDAAKSGQVSSTPSARPTANSPPPGQRQKPIPISINKGENHANTNLPCENTLPKEAGRAFKNRHPPHFSTAVYISFLADGLDLLGVTKTYENSH